MGLYQSGHGQRVRYLRDPDAGLFGAWDRGKNEYAFHAGDELEVADAARAVYRGVGGKNTGDVETLRQSQVIGRKTGKEGLGSRRFWRGRMRKDGPAPK